MASRKVLVCDCCYQDIPKGTGGLLRANYEDQRRGSKVGDLCDPCMEALPGRPAAKRGRKRKVAE